MDQPWFALGDRPDWYDDAACMGLDLALFYGVGDDQQEHGSHRPYLLPAEISEAKQICDDCEVRAACLEWALDAGEEHGIWGGMTHKEREKLRKRRKPKIDTPWTRHLEEKQAG